MFALSCIRPLENDGAIAGLFGLSSTVGLCAFFFIVIGSPGFVIVMGFGIVFGVCYAAIAVDAAIQNVRQHVRNAPPTPWSIGKLMTALLPIGMPPAALIWGPTPVGHMLALEAALVVVWQAALFLGEKIQQLRSGPPSTPPLVQG